MSNVAETLEYYSEGKINRILLVGALMYLNDEDAIQTTKAIESVCKHNTIICIREPIGIEERLTLIEQFSEELEDNYNAIYRTRALLYGEGYLKIVNMIAESLKKCVFGEKLYYISLWDCTCLSF